MTDLEVKEQAIEILNDTTTTHEQKMERLTVMIEAFISLVGRRPNPTVLEYISNKILSVI